MRHTGSKWLVIVALHVPTSGPWKPLLSAYSNTGDYSSVGMWGHRGNKSCTEGTQREMKEAGRPRRSSAQLGFQLQEWIRLGKTLWFTPVSKYKGKHRGRVQGEDEEARSLGQCGVDQGTRMLLRLQRQAASSSHPQLVQVWWHPWYSPASSVPSAWLHLQEMMSKKIMFPPHKHALRKKKVWTYLGLGQYQPIYSLYSWNGLVFSMSLRGLG